ncbi:hypothetical protein FOA43_002752 [Brettanomyces nanus]|uniref:Uncharacterized protein n=1 Tax=Eeniella nana TaxID=13502 RepID=A0A875S371_EENNA|nr:uncharacterized protein FOA43_002752 [Brettanomyces nanus]QPG75398.1 hypothetical protein FOA43_002752 [Brettanomyces nanus]
MSEHHQAKADTIKSSSLAHIKGYPLVSDSIKFISSVPLTSLIAHYISLSVHFILSYAITVPYFVAAFSFVDSYVDSGLSKIDSALPAFTKVSASDISRVIRSYLGYYVSTAYHYVEKFADPLIKSINDLYKRGLDFFLPVKLSDSITPTASATPVDQVHRSYALAKETYSRLQPFFKQASAIPNHVSTVYKDEKAQSSSTHEAVAKTTTKLSGEVYTTLKPRIGKIVGAAQATYTNTAAAVDPVILPNNVDTVNSSGIEIRG